MLHGWVWGFLSILNAELRHDEGRLKQSEKTVSKVVASCAPGFTVPWIWRVHSKFWPKFGCTKISRKVIKKNDPVPSKLAWLRTLFLELWKGYLPPSFIPSVSPHISLQINNYAPLLKYLFIILFVLSIQFMYLVPILTISTIIFYYFSLRWRRLSCIFK